MRDGIRFSTLLVAMAIVPAILVLGAPLRADGDEPPRQFMLEVDGTTHPVKLGEPFELEIAGEKVRMKLTAGPYRQFSEAGIRFQYPASHAFEVDRETPGGTMWTFDGNDSVIILTRYLFQEAGEDLLEAVTASVEGEFDMADVWRSTTTIELAGRKLRGNRLEVTVAGSPIRQDLFWFEAGHHKIVLMLQDSLTADGETTSEAAAVLELLEKTFEITQERGNDEGR